MMRKTCSTRICQVLTVQFVKWIVTHIGRPPVTRVTLSSMMAGRKWTKNDEILYQVIEGRNFRYGYHTADIKGASCRIVLIWSSISDQRNGLRVLDVQWNTSTVLLCLVAEMRQNCQTKKRLCNWTIMSNLIIRYAGFKVDDLVFSRLARLVISIILYWTNLSWTTLTFRKFPFV